VSGKVQLEDAGGGVRVMRFADAARRNAIDRAMRDDMATATAAVARDASARVLVLRADGPAFCAGADLVETFGDASEKPIETVRDELGRIYDVILGVRELAIPTIAAVRGAAIGAGMNIALACDVRIVASDAQLGAVSRASGCTRAAVARTSSLRRSVRSARCACCLTARRSTRARRWRAGSSIRSSTIRRQSPWTWRRAGRSSSRSSRARSSKACAWR